VFYSQFSLLISSQHSIVQAALKDVFQRIGTDILKIK
jgi:hypothetical protein